jgi:hypothetical protein
MFYGCSTSRNESGFSDRGDYVERSESSGSDAAAGYEHSVIISARARVAAPRCSANLPQPMAFKNRLASSAACFFPVNHV